MYRVRVLAVISVIAAVLSSCREPTCSSDDECPSYAYCDVAIGECFTPADGGTTKDAGVPGFSFSLDPTAAAVEQGQSVAVQVNFIRDAAFKGAVELALASPPTGISATPVTVEAATSSGTLTIHASHEAAVGAAQVTVRGTSGSLEWSSTLELEVQPAAVLAVDFSSPSSDVFTNASVSFEVVVTGGTPELVELLRDGEPLATLQAPYSYAWDTTSVNEGTYAITARATRAGATFSSSTRNVTVDRTAPTVVARAPAPGSSASVKASITVEFDEALAPSSVSAAAVALSDGMAMKATTVSLLSDERTVSIIPAATPVAPANYSVNITGITDRAGNAATASWSWSYPAWLQIGPPLSAVSGSTPSEAPSLRLDGAGAPVVAWVESDGASKNVYVARWDGTSWQQYGGPLSAVPGPGTHAARPALALDAVGNPVVAWVESVSSSKNAVHVARWTNSAWAMLGTGLLVNTGASTPAAYRPDVEVTSGGDPIVAWGEYGTPDSIHVAKWSGASWALYSSVAPSTTVSITDPSLALDGNSHPVVAFSEPWFDSATNQSGRKISVRRWFQAATSGWTSYGTGVGAASQMSAVSPSLRVSKTSGRPVVTWMADGGMFSKSIEVASWDGSGWAVLPSPHSGNATPLAPALALDGSSAPVVAWSSLHINFGTLITTSAWTGMTWTPFGTVGVLGMSNSAFVTALELQSDGRAIMAYVQTTSSGSNAHVAVQNR